MQRAIMLQDNLRKAADLTDGEITFGTACSGTDLLVAQLRILADFWLANYGVRIRFRHRFACDVKAAAQNFIMEHWEPEMLFEDVCKISVHSKDVLSGQLCQAPYVDIFVSGFECDNYSALNLHHSTAPGSIEEVRGPSGESASGCLSYVFHARPAMVCFENVKNLNMKRKDPETGEHTSDLDVIQRLMNANGYLMQRLLLNARHYLSPQNRERWYLFCTRVSDGPIDQGRASFEPPHNLQLLPLYLRDMRVQEPFSVEDFLLEDDDPNVLRWLQERRRTKEKDRGKKGEEFKVVHLEEYQHAKLTWPPVYKDDEQLALATEHLPERQRECAWYHVKVAESQTVATEHIIDLNLNLEWSAACNTNTECPYIVSTSKLFAVGRRRELCGNEALALQGLWHSELKTDQFSNLQIIDLAGNAFNGFVLQALFVGIVSVFPWELLGALGPQETGADVPGGTSIKGGGAADSNDESDHSTAHGGCAKGGSDGAESLDLLTDCDSS